MDDPHRSDRPVVIAHRGASGYRPEHTLAAYELAIQQGADFIEPDLVLTRDAVLIARHDNLLDFTTNVAKVAETDSAIAALKTTKTVDGEELTGWFAEDFSLDQIKRLRAVERIPDKRPANAALDGRYGIPTFGEVIELALQHRVGIYPETKYPTHLKRETGVRMSKVLLDTLQSQGIDNFSDLPTFIQSFEVQNLKWLREEMPSRGMNLPLVQLLADRGQPYDVAASGGTLDYRQMATKEGLQAIAEYAEAVGPEKHFFIVPRDQDGNLDARRVTTFVGDAHAAGLLVHAYTFRAENAFLSTNFQLGDAGDAEFDNLLGNAVGEMKLFLATGIDGFFTDHPDMGRAAVDDP